MVITKNRVDDLIMDGSKVRGMIAGEEIRHVVLAADGVMSQVAEKAGLHQQQKPLDYAVAIEEVIELSPQISSSVLTWNRRGHGPDVCGAMTHGMFGGGFLYTNLE